MKRTAISAPLFHLPMTLASGQVFHWVAEEKGFAGLIDRRPVSLEWDEENEVLFVSPGDEATLQRVRRYFALDHPLEAIYATFPDEPAMQEALAYCRGVRIIRQPLWECLATFITSAMKQVKHIQQMSHALRSRFGEETGGVMRAYPTPYQIASAGEEALRECGLGFRAKGLLGAARAICEGRCDLEKITAMGDEEALQALCALPGVGPKIANCVLLFAYERVRAFPIDVWIERVLRHHYFPRRRKMTLDQLQVFAAKHFGPYGGYAQQYLFHHARNQPRSVWGK